MENEPTDEKLAAMSVSNQAFFAVLVGRYEDRLLRYIKRRTRISDKDAEDILQEVFIKIYLNLKNFDPCLKFSSWAYRIAHNQVISDHRKRKTRGEESYDLEADIFLQIASKIDIEEEFINKENIELMSKAVEMLSEKYKDIIILRFFEDQDYDAISDILKIPAGTVATRLNRAKKQLKEILIKQHG